MNEATSPAWDVQLGGKRKFSSSAARAQNPATPVGPTIPKSCQCNGYYIAGNPRGGLKCECKDSNGNKTRGVVTVELKDGCKLVNNDGLISCE